MAKSLTIGMSTFDDYDGVYFSVQAIRLYHPEVKDSTEILIVDNNPTGHCSLALRKLEKSVSGCRYVANHGVQSTASKDVVFREAQCPYILCIDSHVMLVSGAIQKLITYFEQNPESKDLLQGPLLYDNLSDIATHFRPVWSGGMHGVWANDPQGADEGNTPFEIPMQGMGLFSCRKDAWLGFNPRFVGFGGEEGYIHIKYRKAGRRTLCLPFLRWIHRFDRPMGIAYTNTYEDRLRNYLIGYAELRADVTPIESHFRELMGKDAYKKARSTVTEEMAGPFFFFDSIYLVDLPSSEQASSQIQKELQSWRIARRVVIHHGDDDDADRRKDEEGIWTELLGKAKQYGLARLLILDASLFIYDLGEQLHRRLSQLVEEVDDSHWRLCLFAEEDTLSDKESVLPTVRSAIGLNTVLAVAVNTHSCADEIRLPPSIARDTLFVFEAGEANLTSDLPTQSGTYLLIELEKKAALPKEISKSKLRRRDDMRLEQFDGEIVLYHPVKTQAVYLNKMSAVVWGLCDGTLTGDQITDLLVDAYPDQDRDTIVQELNTVLSEFKNLGIVEAQ